MRLMLSAMARVKGLICAIEMRQRSRVGWRQGLRWRFRVKTVYRSVGKGTEGENDGYVTLKDRI